MPFHVISACISDGMHWLFYPLMVQIKKQVGKCHISGLKQYLGRPEVFRNERRIGPQPRSSCWVPGGPSSHFFWTCTGDPGCALHHLCVLEPGYHVHHMAVTDPGTVLQEDPDLGKALQLCQRAIVRDIESAVIVVESSRCVSLWNETHTSANQQVVVQVQVPEAGQLGQGIW